MELSRDPACRARWGLFSTPMPLNNASHWIDRAAEAMGAERLGSWAVWFRQRLVGCLNFLPRRLDQPDEWLPVLEFRFSQLAYEQGLALQACQALLPFLQSEHKAEHVHALLTPQEQWPRRLAASLGMTLLKTARFAETSVDVFVLSLGSPVPVPDKVAPPNGSP